MSRPSTTVGTQVAGGVAGRCHYERGATRCYVCDMGQRGRGLRWTTCSCIGKEGPSWKGKFDLVAVVKWAGRQQPKDQRH